MTERPILFSAPMVRAILAGRKTQTRRVVQLPRWVQHKQPDLGKAFADRGGAGNPFARPGEAYLHVPCAEDDSVQRVYSPFGAPGDRLWVREAWTAELEWPVDPGEDPVRWWHQVPAAFRGPKNVMHTFYRADGSAWDCAADGTKMETTWVPTVDDWEEVRWNASIHMPRWASRLTLEIIDVRVERLQDISEDDAVAEGVERLELTARSHYHLLWNDINAKRGAGWALNPFVWVLEFRGVDTWGEQVNAQLAHFRSVLQPGAGA